MPKLLGLYPLPPARATASHAEVVAVALHSVEIEALPRRRAPKKPETGDF
jgi:hypothetical protein